MPARYVLSVSGDRQEHAEGGGDGAKKDQVAVFMMR